MEIRIHLRGAIQVKTISFISVDKIHKEYIPYVLSKFLANIGHKVLLKDGPGNIKNYLRLNSVELNTLYDDKVLNVGGYDYTDRMEAVKEEKEEYDFIIEDHTFPTNNLNTIENLNIVLDLFEKNITDTISFLQQEQMRMKKFNLILIDYLYCSVTENYIMNEFKTKLDVEVGIDNIYRFDYDAATRSILYDASISEIKLKKFSSHFKNELKYFIRDNIELDIKKADYKKGWR